MREVLVIDIYVIEVSDFDDGMGQGINKESTIDNVYEHIIASEPSIMIGCFYEVV